MWGGSLRRGGAFGVPLTGAGSGIGGESEGKLTTRTIASKMNAPAIQRPPARRLKRFDCVSDITLPSASYTFPKCWCRDRSDTRSRSHRIPDGDTYFEWYADRRIVHTSSNHCYSGYTTGHGVPFETKPPNTPYNSRHHRLPLSVRVAVRVAAVDPLGALDKRAYAANTDNTSHKNTTDRWYLSGTSWFVCGWMSRCSDTPNANHTAMSDDYDDSFLMSLAFDRHNTNDSHTQNW